MADIVDDFLTRLAQHMPAVPPEVRHQIEREVRAEWGGAKPYVAKLGRSMRVSLVATGLVRGQPLSECFAQAGVSQATGYRILQRKS